MKRRISGDVTEASYGSKIKRDESDRIFPVYAVLKWSGLP